MSKITTVLEALLGSEVVVHCGYDEDATLGKFLLGGRFVRDLDDTYTITGVGRSWTFRVEDLISVEVWQNNVFFIADPEETAEFNRGICPSCHKER